MKSFSKIGFCTIEKSFGCRKGLNYKLSPLSAGLGIQQLARLSNKLERRLYIASLWKKYLCIGDIAEINYNAMSIPSYYSLVLIISKFKGKDATKLSSILAQHNVITDIYRYKYKILPEYPVFSQGMQNKLSNDFVNARKLISRLLILPTHEGIKEEDIPLLSNLILQCIQ